MALVRASAVYSSIITAPIDVVWDLLKDYNGMPNWHPAVEKSDIVEGANNQIGAVRLLSLGNGGKIWERLVAMDEAGKSFTYEFCMGGKEKYTQSETTFPAELENYKATVTLYAVTATKQTLWEWKASWDVNSEQKEEMEKFIGDGIFKTGQTAVAEKHKA